MAQSTLQRGPVTGTAVKAPSRAPFFVEFWRTSLGKKWVMAVTGIIGMAFVLGHMIGNFKVFLGPEEYNHYAEFLRDLLVPIVPRTVALWGLRIVLILSLVLHIWAASSLTRQNLVNRPVRYQGGRDYVAANFASRTMRVTGVIVFLFLIFHLADLTWGWIGSGWVRGEVYANLVYSLSRWPVAIIYMVGAVAVSIHLFHGAWSLFQSLGWNNPRFNKWRRWFAIGFAVVMLGNLAFPIAVLTGVVS